MLYNGIRVARFAEPGDRVKVRRELEIPEDGLIVLNVGRFVPHKRQEVVVQVAERLLGQRQDVYFLLIGAGELKETIEELVDTKGLRDHFRFISGLASIDPYWLAADVFAFPSSCEGFGIVIIEAAAAGLRVIAQNIPGVREAATVCTDPTFLPLEATTDDWAQALLCALEAPRIPQEQRQSLLQSFPFTIDESMARLREVYGL